MTPDVSELLVKPAREPAGVPGRPRGTFLLHLRLGLLGYKLALRPPFNLALLEAQHKRRDLLPIRRFRGGSLIRLYGGEFIAGLRVGPW